MGHSIKKNINLYTAIIEVESTAKIVQKIKSDNLLPACETFRDNMSELQSIFLLPMILVLHGVESTEGIEIFRRAMIELGISRSKKKVFPKERVEKKMEEILNRKGKDSCLNFALSVLDRFWELRRLQGIRNLIVHRGGIVDERYNRATATNHPVGEPIEIDGAIIRTMANSVIHTSLQLIEWVDEWLRTRTK